MILIATNIITKEINTTDDFTNMYICICNSVTEADIEKAVDNGANSLHHLKTELRCSTQCGGCSERAQSCLHNALEKQAQFADITFA